MFTVLEVTEREEDWMGCHVTLNHIYGRAYVYLYCYRVVLESTILDSNFYT